VPAVAAAPLAHPVSGDYHLDLPVGLAALGAALLLFAVALAWPQRPAPTDRERWTVASWAGSLTKVQWATRVLSVLLLALVIAAGRLGTDDELENLAPALAVGTAWPLLVLGSLVAGPVWRWLDPWDTIARAVTPDDAVAGPRHVWPAAVLAAPLVWYLSAYTDPLDPRSVGTALAFYTIVTVSGCVALGRGRWLSSAEPIGILLSWIGLAATGRLRGWQPPRGAEVLLGVLIGGLLFGAIRRSSAWSGAILSPHSVLYGILGLVVSCAVVAGFLAAMAVAADRAGGKGSVARAAVPALAGIVIALALARNRLFGSVQLLPGLLGDPFGAGWDLLGPSVDALNPAPLGTTGLLAAQLVVLVLAHLRAAVLLGLDRNDRVRAPAAATLAVLAAGSVSLVALH